MAKHKPTPTAKRIAEINAQPTMYTFNFKDVPSEIYTEKLNLLFHDPNFAEAVEKRNKLVNSAGRMRQNSNEMFALIKAIQQRDRKLADLMYAAIVQMNIRSEVTYDFLSFSTLLKYYVDYSQPGMHGKVNRLSANLDKITFLSDMLESVLVDVKSEMMEIFGTATEFNQFDAVKQVLTQLRGFFKTSRSSDISKPEAQLYFDYSDSINEYLEKRLKTYSEKYRKIHPVPKTYTVDEMTKAINQIFGISPELCSGFIRHTESGGAYIDAVTLVFNLTPSQIEKIEKNAGKPDTKDILNYCFRVTDAVMACYQPET